MFKRFTLFGDLRFTFTMARVTKVVGVNSEVDEDLHIIMWDFDHTELNDVIHELRIVQTRYFLSDIIIVQSSSPDNYIAYCFSTRTFQRVCEIISATQGIDWNFFKYGVYRKRFTLRVSEKNGNQPKFAFRLEGFESPDCTPDDLRSWVKYETLKGVF